jgi:CBS domain containing-hemolysin-like protein
LRGDPSVRETLEELIEEQAVATDAMAPDERLMLRNILGLRDVTVGDIMVPRADMVAVDCAKPFEDIVDYMVDAAHSRVPVYRTSLDDVIGMLHVKDVFAASRDKAKPLPQVEELLRPVLFVPPSMPALDALVRMRTARTHMAVVVDEYGGIDGLLTIEDLVEEIVGEIEDEHDEEEAPVQAAEDDGSIRFDARTPLVDLEERFGPFLSEDEREDIDTLGGLVATLAGRMPPVGTLVVHPSGFEFEVLEADPRRVSLVRLRNPPALIPDTGL